jgi:hypothetical protein
MRQQMLFVLWLVAPPGAALAQSVTQADLEGHVVEARVVMDQQLRREGRDFPAQLDQRLRLRFLPGAAVEFHVSSTSHTPRGTKPGPDQKGRVVIGKVVDARNMDGGQAVWVFEDGALTSLRTYGNAGGYKRTISFARSDKGLTCVVKATFVREEGVGRVATRSVIDNVPVTILSAKQSASNCRVSKGPAN